MKNHAIVAILILDDSEKSHRNKCVLFVYTFVIVGREGKLVQGFILWIFYLFIFIYMTTLFLVQPKHE